MQASRRPWRSRRISWLPSALACAVMLAPGPSALPASVNDVLAARSTAESAYMNSNWKQSLALYSSLVAQNPDDGSLWWRLGRTQSHLGNHRDAIASYQNAIILGFIDEPDGLYRTAQEYAALRDNDSALRFLKLALAAGYRNKVDIVSDPSFAPLTGDSTFRALLGVPYATDDRRKGWLHDLDYLISEIKRVHYLYRNQPLPSRFDSDEEVFRMNVSRMADAEALLNLQRLVADLGDGHSLIYPAGMKRGVFHTLPLHFYWFSDGLFIVGSNVYPDLIGGRVLKIGGIAPERLVEDLKRYMSRENDSEVRWVSPGYLIIYELLEMAGAAKDNQVSMTIRDRRGSVREMTIVPRDRAAIEDDFDIRLPSPGTKPPLYLAQSDKNYWFTDIPNGIVYVQFNHVQNDEHESLKAFAIRVRQSLGRADVRAMILDLRNNNGGEATLTPDLLDTLVWFEVEKGEHAIAAIIGRDTFSAAQDFTNYLDIMTHPIYVGEPTGSKPFLIGDTAMFVLPYSGAVGQLAPGIHADSLYRDDRVWIAPTIPVALSSTDYFAGKDPALEAAILALSNR